ncbi:MAG TPA: GNAT family N-acetyltransferase [Sphingomicrobium sp.]
MSPSIRLASEADAAAIAAIYRPYVEQSRISFEEVAPDTAEMAARMQSELHPWLVIEQAGELLGYVASSPYHRRPAYRWTVETGIYLAQQARGRGLGRELLSAMIELLTRQGFVTAIGAIALPNEASVALHEKLGFTRSGTYQGVGFKLGEWTSVGLWQRDLAPRSDRPQEPLPYAGLAV